MYSIKETLTKHENQKQNKYFTSFWGFESIKFHKYALERLLALQLGDTLKYYSSSCSFQTMMYKLNHEPTNCVTYGHSNVYDQNEHTPSLISLYRTRVNSYQVNMHRVLCTLG